MLGKKEEVTKTAVADSRGQLGNVRCSANPFALRRTRASTQNIGKLRSNIEAVQKRRCYNFIEFEGRTSTTNH